MFNNKVVVYGKPECPYCVKATGILDAKGIKYTYVDVSVDSEAKAFLDSKGHKTVPQIYVNDNYHGESESAKTVSNSEGGIRVVKRDGSLEPLDINKIHKVVEWAAEGLDVSISQVEIDSRLQFYDCIPTENIQKTIIKAAADLISVDYPDYQYLAARLVVFNLRKKVYGRFEPPTLLDHVKVTTAKGVYDEHILRDYSEKEFEELDKYIKHDNDMKFAYAGIMQMEGKYLVQNRVTKEVYETPQFLYMLIGMCLFSKYEGKRRIQLVKEFYDETSKFKLSLPTPIMSGVRTPTHQFSSCVLLETGDDLDSINATTSAIVKYVSQRAGIGINGGRIRALGSEIRGGEARHTGVIPFWKMFQSAVKSCSQGGVRGGAATMFYPFWHLELESLLVLKNNKGIEENRIRHLDYGVQLTKLMYERLITDDYISLFSPNDVEGMYDAFFQDQDLFRKLYTEAEANPLIHRKRVKAVDVFSLLASERASTGRIYIQNVDHCNTNSPFDASVAPIRQSNLCVAPETQILTDTGYWPISTLEGETVNVWNGEQFSSVVVVKTGENQELLEVVVDSFVDGKCFGQSILKCTPYHKWYNSLSEEIRTAELSVGDQLEGWIDTGGKQRTSTVVSITPCGNDDTYCFHEPERNRGVFNGILTGQCLEIALPTKPLNNVLDEDGEVALCTLAALNLGVLKTHADIEKTTEIAVRALDALLDYQNYPLPAALRSSMGRRTLGIGVINYANWLAKQGFKYSDSSGNNKTHELFEAIQYYCLKASNNLAKEFGACPYFHETTYAAGILPIDRYKKDVDALHSAELLLNWEVLRADILQHGLRNSTLTAIAPTETSAQVSNATNGIEPPRGYVSVKSSKDGVLRQVVPELKKLKSHYELLWDIPDNKGYLDKVGIMQKFIDQSISANTNYDPSKFEDGKVPLQVLLHDLLYAYKVGAKTLYYHNTRDGSSTSQDEVVEVEDESCAGGACKI